MVSVSGRGRRELWNQEWLTWLSVSAGAVTYHGCGAVVPPCAFDAAELVRLCCFYTLNPPPTVAFWSGNATVPRNAPGVDSCTSAVVLVTHHGRCMVPPLGGLAAELSRSGWLSRYH